MKTVQSSIFIRNLRLYAFHGVLPQERRTGGWYTVSLHVHYDVSKAMSTDNVDDTLNYAELCSLVRREMAQPSSLLEHVASRIAQSVFNSFPDTLSIDLTLTKENPPMGVNCQGAGVELHLINNKSED